MLLLLFSLGHVGRSPMLGLVTVLGPVVATTTVETGVNTGRLAFPAATTSPFSTAGAAVTALLKQLSATILGRR
jgi:hypothetical protein